MSSTRECVRFTAWCGYWEGLPTTPCRTEIIPISSSCQHRVLPASVLPVGSALVAPKPTEEEVLKPVHGLLLPGFDIAVIFSVPTWVDNWFFLLLINVIFQSKCKCIDMLLWSWEHTPIVTSSKSYLCRGQNSPTIFWSKIFNISICLNWPSTVFLCKMGAVMVNVLRVIGELQELLHIEAQHSP